jgi:4-amino-4-deoxy-L-arabinose transferase-like glycosyltransferase
VVPVAHRLTLLLGWGFFAGAAALLLPGLPSALADAGVVLWLAAAALLWSHNKGWACALLPDATPAPHPTPQPPVRWRLLLLALIPLLLLVQAHFVLREGKFAPVSLHVQVALALVGWSGVLIAVCGWRLRIPRPHYRLQAHHLALLLIALLAAGTRLYRLETGIHRWIDEYNFLEAVVQLYESDHQALLMPFNSITAFSWFYPYTQWLLTSLGGPSVAAVRLPSVVFGVGQALALYWLMTQIASRRAALAGALLLATFPPALHFSRIGINNVADPFFGLLALGWLARGLRSGRRSHFALAGLCLGLTHYFYEGGRLFFSLFALCWLGWHWLTLPRGARRLPWRALAAGLVVFAAVAGPLYAAWLYQAKPLFPRYNATRMLVATQSSPAATANPWQRLRDPLLSATTAPDRGAFYRSEAAFVPPPLVPLYLLGFMICLWRWRSPGGGMLFWWVTAAGVGNALIISTVDAPRYCVALPAMCGVLAIGAEAVWRAVEQKQPHTALKWGIAATLIVVALAQAAWYLGHHMAFYTRAQFYDETDPINGRVVLDQDDVVWRAALLPPPVEIYLLGRGFKNTFGLEIAMSYFRITGDYNTPFRWEYSPRLLEGYQVIDSSATPKAFFIEPEDTALLAWLRARYTLYGPYYSPFSAPPERQYALWVTDPRLAVGQATPPP